MREFLTFSVKGMLGLHYVSEEKVEYGTPHLNGKKLSTNSPWDFEYVLETMDDY